MEEVVIKERMNSVIAIVADDISTIRTGRATSAMVESIVCPAYGGTQRLKVRELASISIPDPQTILIDPWDKSIIGDIRKGILEANIGLNPNIDGDVIRIVVPAVTSEERMKLVKLLHQKLEAGRVMIRQIRGDVMHEIKKKFEAKEISEDEKFRQEKRVQEITDEFIGKIDDLGKRKEAELISI
jgi:ribosome recycling factor